MTQFFRGNLAGLTIRSGKLTDKKVIDCLYTCKEGLDLHTPKAMAEVPGNTGTPLPGTHSPAPASLTSSAEASVADLFLFLAPAPHPNSPCSLGPCSPVVPVCFHPDTDWAPGPIAHQTPALSCQVQASRPLVPTLHPACKSRVPKPSPFSVSIICRTARKPHRTLCLWLLCQQVMQLRNKQVEEMFRAWGREWPRLLPTPPPAPCCLQTQKFSRPYCLGDGGCRDSII